ncbi:MAG: hypothetical protein RLZZ336_529 [Cyanobacteriota bacterium]|jgi:hypothetical protein
MDPSPLSAGAVMTFTPEGPSDTRARARRGPSRRFLSSDELSRRPRGDSELFAEGQWQAIRVHLEQQGWCQSQIDLVHDQLRQGWPLATAKLHAARLSGHCPIRAQADH